MSLADEHQRQTRAAQGGHETEKILAHVHARGAEHEVTQPVLLHECVGRRVEEDLPDRVGDDDRAREIHVMGGVQFVGFALPIR